MSDPNEIKFFEEQFQEKLTDEIEIEGIGIIRVYGELNMDALVEKLLESKAITD